MSMRASGSAGNNNHFNSAMREHMFDKVLTPSDVGKLNRLVIPKQHAENYFPLENNLTGTVLDFEDKTGKMWRLRYSYWNSSQSYVMTKGWSRFVKEKRLESGDIVSFHRGHVPDDNEPEKRRNILFIDWRHRAITNINHHRYPFLGSSTYPTATYYPVTEYSMPHYRRFPPFYQEREFLGYGFGRIVHGPLDHHHQWNLGRSEPLVYDSYPVLPTTRLTSPSAMLPPSLPPQPPTVKKVRLFGVDVGESPSSGGEMSIAGYSPSSPVVIRDDESTWRSSRGEMGASSSSSVMQLTDDEEYQRKGKSVEK
ncbi:hypothetical protein Bca4012_019231 [Brassica carinata]|uniref:TF-B3 domain-containing protein n=1 Tax=Brassica carinata TaxID=52824 RepID=A0A8X7WHY2_BRACI|nr:hypothetical protein Bca52824_002364 [Brassica carinata]